jgi:phosphoglycolate phosphatase-like HAD superfamily hydrolase
VIIVVDLDGTLITFDSSLSLAKRMASKNIFLALKLMFIYLMGAEAKAKQFVANHCGKLQYKINQKVLNFLKSKKKDHKLILATGTNMKIAQQINQDLENLFEEVIASSDSINCIGENKLNEIKGQIGDQKFLYIGDWWHDMPIWLDQNASIGIVERDIQLCELMKKIAQKESKDIIVFEYIKQDK